MTKTRVRRFSQDFKVSTVERMLAGENVSALARSLKVKRKLGISGTEFRGHNT